MANPADKKIAGALLCTVYTLCIVLIPYLHVGGIFCAHDNVPAPASVHFAQHDDDGQCGLCDIVANLSQQVSASDAFGGFVHGCLEKNFIVSDFIFVPVKIYANPATAPPVNPFSLFI